MILLKSSADTLKMTTSTAALMDAVVMFADLVGTTVTVDDLRTNSIAASTYSICLGAATTSRGIKSVNICNKDATLSCLVTIFIANASDIFILRRVTLAPRESLAYDDNVGWNVYDAEGRIETKSAAVVAVGAESYTLFKQGTAAEAAQVDYCFSKDSGTPGAWSPGAPGLNGRATDASTVADAGCLALKAAAAGKSKSLVSMIGSSNQVATLRLFDLMWVNTGLVVTTITPQTFASVAFPARDINLSANGENCMVGVLVTAPTTNAAAITNMTLNYTNSLGVAGVASMAAFPATAVVGTVVWFQLAAGDVGVRSIQSVTLGTSLVTGTISLILARQFSIAASPSAAFPSIPIVQGNLIVPEKACLILFNSAALTSAVQANLVVTAQDI